MNIQAVGIVRQRGQLTIPESIRKVASWITPSSAISISVVKPDEIIIKPHQSVVDWDKIWEGIRKARAIKGKGKTMSASEFLEQDRRSH